MKALFYKKNTNALFSKKYVRKEMKAFPQMYFYLNPRDFVESVQTYGNVQRNY